MRNISLLFLCLVFTISCKQKKSDTTDSPVAEEEEFGKWTDLFNGENLDGWTMKIVGHELGENFGNTFRVEDDILSIRYDAYEDNFDNRFGALYFKEKLTNYRLKVEYRFVGETCIGAPAWGYRDSGVQFHSQAPETVGLDQQFPVSLEFNLHGGNGTDDRPVGEICAGGTFVEVNGVKNESFCTPATVKRTFHGDQWVTIEIDVRDGKISHFANGEEILSYKNPTYDTNHEIGKTLIVNGDMSVKDGYISLQSNSHPIDFRSVQIMRY